MQFAFSFSGFLFWVFLFPSFARYFLDIVTVEKEKGKHGFFTELWQKLPPLRRVQAPWQRIPADGGWPPATSHSASSSLPLRPPSWSLPPPFTVHWTAPHTHYPPREPAPPKPPWGSPKKYPSAAPSPLFALLQAPYPPDCQALRLRDFLGSFRVFFLTAVPPQLQSPAHSWTKKCSELHYPYHCD